MTIQTPKNGRETPSFKIADRKIENLKKRLNDKSVCPCCIARALAMHAASLAIPSMGSVEAIEMFENIVGKMHKHNVPAPSPMPSTEAH
jgi:hypothetical protein